MNFDLIWHCDDSNDESCVDSLVYCDFTDYNDATTTCDWSFDLTTNEWSCLGDCYRTKQPTFDPTGSPTLIPSLVPSKMPTNEPSNLPTIFPSAIPSVEPTFHPSILPTLMPSIVPTVVPSHNPTKYPSFAPSSLPSNIPTIEPSLVPSKIPSNMPSHVPTSLPSDNPTKYPSFSPSFMPTIIPTSKPTIVPSNFPSNEPTIMPSLLPTITPTQHPLHETTNLVIQNRVDVGPYWYSCNVLNLDEEVYDITELYLSDDGGVSWSNSGVEKPWGAWIFADLNGLDLPLSNRFFVYILQLHCFFFWIGLFVFMLIICVLI